MFEPKSCQAAIAVKDLERAKSWYADKLGLKPTDETPEGVFYDVGSSRFYVYQTEFAGGAQHTVASFEVDDIEGAVAALRENGVVFEEYDLPNLKTQDGIATIGDTKAAWFKDSEGNILAVGTP